MSVRGVPLSSIRRGISPQGTTNGLVKADDRRAFFIENLRKGYHIGRIAADGTVTEIYRKSVAPFIRSIAVTPNGYIWLTQSNGRLMRIDSHANVTEFKPEPGTTSSGLTIGDDGNVWVTEQNLEEMGTPFIARVAADGATKAFALPAGANPVNIAAGPDGNLWFSEYLHERIGRLNPKDGGVTEFNLSPGSGMAGAIVTGPDGKLWFTQFDDRIGQITTGGAIKNFQSGIRPNAGVTDIAPGSDGNLWFTESRADCIARITPDGVVTEF